MNTIADLLDQNQDLGNLRSEFGAGGFLLGTVTDNSDKEFAGMVKVEFTSWMDRKNICEWIPLLLPYAGKDHGSYLIPEIGDVVLVGFIGQDMRRPFVFGCLFPGNSAMERESFHKKNEKRRFKTKGGIELTLIDEENKASFTAVTPGGLRCALEDEAGTITLTDKNGKNHLTLDTKKGEMLLDTKSAVTIKCGKCEISLAQSGAISIKCQSLDVKAANRASVSGGKVEASGSEVALTGKLTAQIKGGIVKIN